MASMSALLERLVRNSRSVTPSTLAGLARDLTALAPVSPTPSPTCSIATSLDGSSGKTSKTFSLHDMRAGSLALSRGLPTAGMAAPGASSITVFSARQTNLARDFTWSDIVVTCLPHERYFLSSKALSGIARRKRKPRLFSPQEGAWLSMTERHAFWTGAVRA